LRSRTSSPVTTKHKREPRLPAASTCNRRRPCNRGRARRRSTSREFIRKIDTGNYKGSAAGRSLDANTSLGYSCRALFCPVGQESSCVGRVPSTNHEDRPADPDRPSSSRFGDRVGRYEAKVRYWEEGERRPASEVVLVGAGPSSLACGAHGAHQAVGHDARRPRRDEAPSPGAGSNTRRRAGAPYKGSSAPRPLAQGGGRVPSPGSASRSAAAGSGRANKRQPVSLGEASSGAYDAIFLGSPVLGPEQQARRSPARS